MMPLRRQAVGQTGYPKGHLMRRSIATLVTISLLALGACSSDGDTGSGSSPSTSSSSEPLQAPPSDAAEASADAAKEAAANGASEPVPIPTFESAYDAISGPQFSGYWDDGGTVDPEEYRCSKDRQEIFSKRDMVTGEVVQGTTIECWTAEVEEYVTVHVLDDHDAMVDFDCMVEWGTCFDGYGWNVDAENTFVLKEVLANMGLDKKLIDTIEASPEYQ